MRAEFYLESRAFDLRSGGNDVGVPTVAFDTHQFKESLRYISSDSKAASELVSVAAATPVQSPAVGLARVNSFSERSICECICSMRLL